MTVYGNRPVAAKGLAALPGLGPRAVDPRLVARPANLQADVDVAIVAESTYPYLKGGVSAVMHDIVKENPFITFGIIHIAWDSHGSREDLYGMPRNVQWVHHVYLSMQEHRDTFMAAQPKELGMRPRERTQLAHRLFDALAAIVTGDVAPFWQLYDEGLNPRTRSFSMWPILGTKEFMSTAMHRLQSLGLTFTDTFWLLREFFSLGYALLSTDVPKARVYHAHTTGYASLLGAAGARQNGGKFLLTEHNLYVRDTVNFLLDRSMDLPLTDRDWREFDVPPTERAWMAWWIEMAHLCYPSAEVVTYLYPDAITEAVELGAPIQKSTVVPNGMKLHEFDGIHAQRQRDMVEIASTPDRTWRLAYIARVVPIKGLLDLISTVALLVGRGGVDFHLDVLGPTEHDPDYYEACLEKTRQLGLEGHITFRGTVAVREVLGQFDLLVLPSYNEGQPIVVLEAMTAGIPVVGTEVGGMAQLITDTLTTPEGQHWEPCGRLVAPGDPEVMAETLESVMGDAEAYARYSEQARGRVVNFFQIDDVMRAYHELYTELGQLPAAVSTDPTEANAGAMRLIQFEAMGLLDDQRAAATAANTATIDLIYSELGGPRAEEPTDPIRANVTTIDLIYMASGEVFTDVEVDAGTEVHGHQPVAAASGGEAPPSR